MRKKNIEELDLLVDEINKTQFDITNEVGILSKNILRKNVLYARQVIFIIKQK